MTDPAAVDQLTSFALAFPFLASFGQLMDVWSGSLQALLSFHFPKKHHRGAVSLHKAISYQHVQLLLAFQSCLQIADLCFPLPDLRHPAKPSSTSSAYLCQPLPFCSFAALSLGLNFVSSRRNSTSPSPRAPGATILPRSTRQQFLLSCPL